MHHSSVSWEITLLYFFSWNCTWFGQKEPIKVQNFRLSTAHVKFHQICTLIDSFCWKYIKFQLKKYRGVMSHDTEEWCKIWRKTDLLFQKWQEFGEFWFKHSKVSKIWTLIGPFRAKYITFGLKKYRGVIFLDTWSVMQNLKKNWLVVRKITRNLANFHQNIWKYQIWDFNGMILPKVKNARAKKVQRSYLLWYWKVMQNLKKNWLVV